MTGKDRLEAYLSENRVPFDVQHHPLAYTAQHVAQSEHVPGRLVVKVVVAKADGRFVMLALPAPCRVDLARAAEAAGLSELQLAGEDEFRDAFPDCEAGAMPPFGNLYGLPLYVDRALTEDERIVFQACTHTDTISMSYTDYARLAAPVVADFAVGPKGPRLTA